MARVFNRNTPRWFHKCISTESIPKNPAFRVITSQSLNGSALVADEMNVTAFSTQYDEMRQLRIAAGLETQERTVQLQEGGLVHQNLEEAALRGEDERRVYDLLSSGEGSRQNMEFLKCLGMAQKLETLSIGHGVRELRMRGQVGRYRLRGIIDGVDVDPHTGEMMILENKTTRQYKVYSYMLRLAYHQVLFYHKMFQSLLASPINVQELMAVPDEWLKLEFPAPWDKRTFTDVLSQLEKAITSLRNSGLKLSSEMELRFHMLNSSKVKPQEWFRVTYDEAVLQDVYKFRSDLLEERRGPLPFTLRQLEQEQ